MYFDILTLFPGMFTGPFSESMLARAQRDGLIDIRLRDIREHTTDRHRTVDDTPYGGGPGMVMKPEPLVRAVEHVRSEGPPGIEPRVLLFAPQGRRFDQAFAEELAEESWLVLICGHYEGIDDRVRQLVATDLVSIGDFVLTGGEPAAVVLVDAVARLRPGVLGGEQSTHEESFGSDALLEYPQFTRPPEYRGLKVPDVLLSGNHGEIRRWRRKQAIKWTLAARPDLLDDDRLDAEDKQLLQEIREELPLEES